MAVSNNRIFRKRLKRNRLSCKCGCQNREQPPMHTLVTAWWEKPQNFVDSADNRHSTYRLPSGETVEWCGGWAYWKAAYDCGGGVRQRNLTRDNLHHRMKYA